MPNRFLGKKPAVYDPRRLKFSALLAPQLAAAPSSCDLTCGIRNWGQMLNDVEGDCTAAAHGHRIMSMTAAATGAPVVVSDADVQAVYVATSGYNPATGANDDGAAMPDVLEYIRANGIGGHKIDGWAGLDHNNGQHVCQSIYYLGGVQIGLNLPRSAIEQNQAGQAWTVPWFTTIAGGHAVPGVAYQADGLWCITWGGLQFMSWDFYFRYSDEAYAVQDRLWLNSSNRTPPGYDASILPTALAAVAA